MNPICDLSDVRYKTKKGEKAVLLPSPLYIEDRRNETRIAIHSRFILQLGDRWLMTSYYLTNVGQ